MILTKIYTQQTLRLDHCRALSVPTQFIIGYFFFAVFVFAVSIVRGETTLWSFLQLRDKKELLKNKIVELKSENERLQDEIFKLEHFPHYANKMLKDRFHTLEEGEHIVYMEH